MADPSARKLKRRVRKFLTLLAGKVAPHIPATPDDLGRYLASSAAVLPSSGLKQALTADVGRHVGAFVSMVQAARRDASTSAGKPIRPPKRASTAAVAAYTPVPSGEAAVAGALVAVDGRMRVVDPSALPKPQHASLCLASSRPAAVLDAFLQRDDTKSTAVGRALACLATRADGGRGLDAQLKHLGRAVDEEVLAGAYSGATSAASATSAAGTLNKALAVAALRRSRVCGGEAGGVPRCSPGTVARAVKRVVLCAALAAKLRAEAAASGSTKTKGPSTRRLVEDTVARVALSLRRHPRQLVWLLQELAPALGDEDSPFGGPASTRLLSALFRLCVTSQPPSTDRSGTVEDFFAFVEVLRGAIALQQAGSSSGPQFDYRGQAAALPVPYGLRQWLRHTHEGTGSTSGFTDVLGHLAAATTAQPFCDEAVVDDGPLDDLQAAALQAITGGRRAQARDRADSGSDSEVDSDDSGAGAAAAAAGTGAGAGGGEAPLFFIDTRGTRRTRAQVALLRDASAKGAAPAATAGRDGDSDGSGTDSDSDGGDESMGRGRRGGRGGDDADTRLAVQIAGQIGELEGAPAAEAASDDGGDAPGTGAPATPPARTTRSTRSARSGRRPARGAKRTASDASAGDSGDGAAAAGPSAAKKRRSTPARTTAAKNVASSARRRRRTASSGSQA